MRPPQDIVRCITGSHARLTPFDPDDACAGPLLLGQIALLAIAWWAAVARGDRRGRQWFLLAGSAFVAALVSRVLFVPFVLVALCAAARRRGPAVLSAIACAATAAAVALSKARDVDDLLEPTADPVAETVRWAELENPYRARFWAAQWATRELEPGEGRLTLARMDWELGHSIRARELAAEVAARASDPRLRQRAELQLSAWQRTPAK